MANSRAWLDLRGDDVLYVEGAEDFDITGAEHGEAVQVKASVGGVSHTPEWNEWMSQLETALGAPLGEAAARARDHTGRWIDGMLGSLNIFIVGGIITRRSFPRASALAREYEFITLAARNCRYVLPHGRVCLVADNADPCHSSTAKCEYSGHSTCLQSRHAIVAQGSADFGSRHSSGK